MFGLMVVIHGSKGSSPLHTCFVEFHRPPWKRHGRHLWTQSCPVVIHLPFNQSQRLMTLRNWTHTIFRELLRYLISQRSTRLSLERLQRLMTLSRLSRSSKTDDPEPEPEMTEIPEIPLSGRRNRLSVPIPENSRLYETGFSEEVRRCSVSSNSVLQFLGAVLGNGNEEKKACINGHGLQWRAMGLLHKSQLVCKKVEEVFGIVFGLERAEGFYLLLFVTVVVFRAYFYRHFTNNHQPYRWSWD